MGFEIICLLSLKYTIKDTHYVIDQFDGHSFTGHDIIFAGKRKGTRRERREVLSGDFAGRFHHCGVYKARADY